MSFSIDSGDLLELRIVGEADSQAIINRLTYLATDESGALITLNSQEVLDTLVPAVQADVLSNLCINYRVVRYELLKVTGGVRIVVGSSVTYPRVYGPFVDNRVGDAVNDVGNLALPALPTFVSITARVVTGLRGREWKGSARFSPTQEAASADGGNTLIPATRDVVETDLNDLVDLVFGTPPTNWRLTLQHFSPKSYFDTQSPGDPASGSATDMSFEVNLALGSQLSRKVKSYGR